MLNMEYSSVFSSRDGRSAYVTELRTGSRRRVLMVGATTWYLYARPGKRGRKTAKRTRHETFVTKP